MMQLIYMSRVFIKFNTCAYIFRERRDFEGERKSYRSESSRGFLGILICEMTVTAFRYTCTCNNYNVNLRVRVWARKYKS